MHVARPGAIRLPGSWRRRLSLVLTATLAVLALAPGHARADFQVGLQDPGFTAALGSPSSDTAYDALAAVDGSTIRLELSWAGVAPTGTTMPAGFDPSNPADPQYNWTTIDQELRQAAERHLRVVLILDGAPAWAQPSGEPARLREDYGGAWDPSASDFAQFVHAAASRYSGHFPDPLHPGSYLPRISDWEIWNEENLPLFLVAPHPVAEYRSLLNAAYTQLKAASPSNVVILGGLAPVSYLPPVSTPPLTFAAQLMCLKRKGTSFVRAASCPQQAHFDIFAIHPYSPAATPTKHAYDYDNVLVGDMSKIRNVVRAADTKHTIAPRTTHPIWVTEFGWFTDPPDKLVGDSYATAARYVAYSMYEMWANGVSLVIWFGVRDVPSSAPDALTGGGLDTSAGKPKPTLEAFAFPVVASVSHGRGFVWGHVPVSKSVRVLVERKGQHGWKSLATVATGASGVFEYRFAASGNGTYRAVVRGGATSLPYNSTPIPGKRTHLFNSG